jgi:hypothetical protein
MSAADFTANLRAALGAAAAAGDGGAASRARLLRQLARDALATVPMPGAGATLERWRALAAVAEHDLALAKFYEGHADALAILAEAGEPESGFETIWGMWAAETAGARVVADASADGRCTLSGVKAWCSGARHLDAALLTVWHPDGRGPFLARVRLAQPGVSFVESNWRAVGMAASDSVDVRFDAVDAAGADAGWHRLLALGAVDRVLAANAALLREAASWVDAHPRADARVWALRTRAAADAASELVLREATRALGATPLCRDAAFARMAADLPVFVRQCHGDRDLVALGQQVAEAETAPWRL